MSVQDYMSALKLGKREYNACVNKGKYPYLPVMESMMDEEQIDSEVSLGIDQIPLRLVVVHVQQAELMHLQITGCLFLNGEVSSQLNGHHLVTVRLMRE